MGVRIINGTAQGDLLEACIGEIDRASTLWPDRRAILLVPEQTKADAEKLYLSKTGRSGILMAEVLSFRRLAYRIQGETGGLARPCVDSVGKGILLHSLLREHRSEWGSIGASAGRPGFVPEIEHVMGDLKRHGIDADTLQALAQTSGGEDRFFSSKMADLARLLRLYGDRMEQLGLCDRDDDLWKLAGTIREYCDANLKTAADKDPMPWPIRRLSFLRSSTVWVAGFGQTRDFTPQEYAVLDGLSEACEDLVVTVCADSVPMDGWSASTGSDVFRVGRQVAWRLVGRYPGLTYSGVAPGPGYRTTHPQMARIEKSLLEEEYDIAEPVMATPQEEQAVTTVLAKDKVEEIRWVAGEIRRLTRMRGYRYGDIALGVSDLSGSLSSIRSVFRAYGLSPFIDESRPLAGTPLFRFLGDLLSLHVQNWSLSSVTAFLRSDFSDISSGEGDRLENFLLSRGLSGAGRVFDNRRYRRRAPSYETESDDQMEDPADGIPDPKEKERSRGKRLESEAAAAVDALTLRDRVLVPLREFLADLAGAKSCASMCDRLAGFLENYGIRGKLEQRAASLRAGGEDEAAVTLIRSWNELEHILRQITVIAGANRYRIEALRDALTTGMDSARSGVIPPVIDQVAVSGYARAAFRRPKILFLLGLTGSDFPGVSPSEGLLKDPDRDRISTQTGIRLPSLLRDQVFADAAMAYALLTAPSDHLYLTATADNRALSPYFERIRTVIPAGRHLNLGAPGGLDVRVAAIQSARRYLHTAATEPASTENLERFSAMRAMSDVLGIREEEMNSGRWRVWLDDDRESAVIARGLTREAIGQHPTMSISQLEKYAACPFSYLVSYLFRLQERKVWAPQATDTGILLHGMLEMAVREVGQDLAAAASEEAHREVMRKWLSVNLAEYANRCMDTIIDRDGLDSFRDPGIRASGGRRALRLGETSLRAVIGQIAHDGVLPLETEWQFGMDGDKEGNGGKALEIRFPGATVSFRGVIDRIDRMPDDGNPEEDERRIRVVDYKSGAVAFDPDRVFYGLSLQLPAYAAAYCANYPSTRPHDLLYFQFQDPYARFPVPSDADLPEKADRQIAQAFSMRGTGLETTQIEAISMHTLKRMRALCGSLFSGRCDARPARIGSGLVACRYCLYRAICGHGGKNWYFMKPLNEIVPPDVARKRMNKLAVAVTAAAQEQEREED